MRLTGETEGRTTPSLDELLDELEKYRPMLTDIELRRRLGTARGKLSDRSRTTFAVDDGDGSQAILDQLIAHCEKVETDEGVCTWQATLVLKTDQGTKRVTVPFDLRSGIPIGDGHAESVGAYQQALKNSAEIIGRQNLQIEKLAALVVTTSEAASKVSSGLAEVKRAEYEHQARMREIERQEKRDDEEMEFVSENFPRALAVWAASAQRKKETGGKKQAGWKHLRDAAAKTRDAGGHSGVVSDILEELARVDSKAAAEALFRKLDRQLSLEKANRFHWISRYPDMLEFLDMFSILEPEDAQHE